MLIMASSSALVGISTIIFNQETLIEMLGDCRTFHNPENVVLKVAFKEKSQRALKYAMLAIRVMTWLGYFGGLFLIGGGSLFSYYFEKSQYPLPFMSVFEIQSVYKHALVFVHQSLATFTVTAGLILWGKLLFVGFVYTFAQMDALLGIIDTMNENISEVDYEIWKKIVVELIFDIKRYVGVGDFFENLKISFSQRFMERSKNITLLYLVLLGKLVYMILFTSWIIWQLDPSLISTSLGCFPIPFVLFLIVVINEAFSDRFVHFNASLYGLAWYNFPVKYRRDFLFIMKSVQRPILLSEGGLHDLTFDWFADLLKASYNAGLVLQNMIA